MHLQHLPTPELEKTMTGETDLASLETYVLQADEAVLRSGR
jgi:hypothetical protein